MTLSNEIYNNFILVVYLTNSNINTYQARYNDANPQDAHCIISLNSDLISPLSGSPIYDACITQPNKSNYYLALSNIK